MEKKNVFSKNFSPLQEQYSYGSLSLRQSWRLR